MPDLSGAEVSSFDFIRESNLSLIARSSAFADDANATIRRIEVDQGLEDSTMVVFGESKAVNPFSPSTPLADAQFTARFKFGSEPKVQGLMLAISQNEMVGNWIAVTSEDQGRTPDPNIALARTQITDPSWNTFIRTKAPGENYTADVTLHLWLARKPVTQPSWIQMELDLMLPQGVSKEAPLRPSRAGTADAFGRLGPEAYDLQLVGIAKFAID